jgi:hypothetical protein
MKTLQMLCALAIAWNQEAFNEKKHLLIVYNEFYFKGDG